MRQSRLPGSEHFLEIENNNQQENRKNNFRSLDKYFSDQKVSQLTLDTRLDSHYSQPGPGSSFGTMGTHRLHTKDSDSDRWG